MTLLRPRAALALLLLALPVAASAGPGEWMQTYGDGGHSGYQPIPEFPSNSTFTTISGLRATGNPGVVGAPVIAQGRVIAATQTGADDGIAVRSLATGVQNGGTLSVDDGTSDTDTFGTTIGFGPVDLPGDRVMAVHNDGTGVEVAVIDETTGTRAIAADQAVPGTSGFRTLGAPALSGPLNVAGEQYLAINVAPRSGSASAKLVRVRVTAEGVLLPDATQSVDVPSLTVLASPTFVPISNVLHIVVGASFIAAPTPLGTAQGNVRSYRADTLAPGPQSGDLGGVAATPSIPAASTGDRYVFNSGAPPIYVPVGNNTGATSKVVRLGYSAGNPPLTQPSFTTASTSANVTGNTAPALAVGAEIDPATGTMESGAAAAPIVLLTSRAIATFSADTLAPGTSKTKPSGEGYGLNAPAVSGDLLFAMSDVGVPGVFDVRTLAPNPSFTAPTGGGTQSKASPAVAGSAVVFGSNTGLFGFRGTPYAFSVSSTEVAAPISGSSTARFTVSLSAPSPDTTTVVFSTEDGTAKAGSDYTAVTRTLTFTPNQQSQDVDVTIAANPAPEPNESFTVRLSAPTGGAALGTATGIGTIINATAGFNAGNATVTEGSEGTTDLEFPIVLSDPAPAGGASVDVATSGGTATSNVDFTSRSARITIPEGQTSASFPVAVRGDLVDEADETLTITLSNASGAVIGDGTGTGAIIDDDTAVLSLEEAFLAEPATNGVYTLKLSTPSDREVTARLRTRDGGRVEYVGYDQYLDDQDPATADVDYRSVDTVVRFAPGVTERTVEVVVLDDALSEGVEIFTGALTEITNAQGGTVEALGVIFDDDVSAVSIADASAVESAGEIVLGLTLSKPASRRITVPVSTADGTAVAGSDYTAKSGTVTFPAGSRTASFGVGIGNDAADEPNETIQVRLGEPTGGAVIARGLATATIIDDDAPAGGSGGSGGSSGGSGGSSGGSDTKRVRPRSVSRRVTPRRDRTRPYRFRVTGRVRLPSGVSAREACGTRRAIRVLFRDGGRRTVANARVSLRSNCTYRKTVRFKRSQRFRSKRLIVEVRFLGNDRLLPRSAARISARIGR